jgi:hypothetical protein
MLPERSCANNKLPVVETTSLDLPVACAVLNSFAFDFTLRFRVSSTINFTHIARVAVPPVADCHSISVVDTVSAGGAQPAERDERDFDALWRANRAVAQAYGLTADDFEHILSTFPVFARKRQAFYAYLQERVRERKEETGATKKFYPAPSDRDLSKAAESGTDYRSPSQTGPGSDQEGTGGKRR